MSSKRKNRWQEQRAWKKENRNDLPQTRKEFDKPHPGSYAVEDLANLPTTETENLPKKRMALLLGYCGAGYQGMQMNEGIKSIEKEVERALFRANCIGKQNYGNLQKINWARAARTDKGVSGLGQLVSLKCAIPGGEKNTVNEINKHLPTDIKCFDMIRVTKSFDAKVNCGKRRYRYLLPTYMLMDPQSLTQVLDEAYEQSSSTPTDDDRCAGQVDKVDNDNNCPSNASTNETNTLKEPDWLPKVEASKEHRKEVNEKDVRVMTKELEKFRVGKPVLERLRAALQLFVGSRKYHNFTNNKKIGDPSSLRFIMSFTVSDPFLVSSQSDNFNVIDPSSSSPSSGASEWVALEVVGQSFLLHQIRKMVATASDFAKRLENQEGSACASGLSQEDEALLLQTFEPIKVRTPMVPGLGLYLDRPFFDDYNSAIKRLPPRVVDTTRQPVDTTETPPQQALVEPVGESQDDRQPLVWEEGPVSETLKEFEKGVIWPQIFSKASQEGIFSSWLNTADLYPVSYVAEDVKEDQPTMLANPQLLVTD